MSVLLAKQSKAKQSTAQQSKATQSKATQSKAHTSTCEHIIGLCKHACLEGRGGRLGCVDESNEIVTCRDLDVLQLRPLVFLYDSVHKFTFTFSSEPRSVACRSC